VADGNQKYHLLTSNTISKDPAYNGLAVDDLPLTNRDNRQNLVEVKPLTGVTSEAGAVATFTVKLTTKPTGGTVTVPIDVGDTTEAQLIPRRNSRDTTRHIELVFTTSNWNKPQTVAVKGKDDTIRDGDQLTSILIGMLRPTRDARFQTVDPPDVKILNLDNDRPLVTITPLAPLKTTEAGGAATFTVRLAVKPLAPVTVPFSISPADAKEGKLNKTSLVFTPSDWDKPQLHTITVQGVDDAVVDGDKTYKVLIGLLRSADLRYRDFNPVDLTFVNADNDTPGVKLSDYNGTYEGTFTGLVHTVVPVPVQGTVKFTVSNGSITLITPVQAAGNILLSGDSNFEITTALLKGVHFGGKFKTVGANATISGDFSGNFDDPIWGLSSGDGTWTVTRISV
jgi:hypothetical protein